MPIQVGPVATGIGEITGAGPVRYADVHQDRTASAQVTAVHPIADLPSRALHCGSRLYRAVPYTQVISVGEQSGHTGPCGCRTAAGFSKVLVPERPLHLQWCTAYRCMAVGDRRRSGIVLNGSKPTRGDDGLSATGCDSSRVHRGGRRGGAGASAAASDGSKLASAANRRGGYERHTRCTPPGSCSSAFQRRRRPQCRAGP